MEELAVKLKNFWSNGKAVSQNAELLVKLKPIFGTVGNNLVLHKLIRKKQISEAVLRQIFSKFVRVPGCGDEYELLLNY